MVFGKLVSHPIMDAPHAKRWAGTLQLREESDWADEE